MKYLWARKSVEAMHAEIAETNTSGRGLKRTLSAWNLIALGIGCIIGAGIFVLSGHAAAAHAGPAVVLSFMAGAVVCVFAGLCYTEMASAVPASGSAYTYAYATMGQLVAWIIGWDLVLEYALGATTVAIGWSGYVVSFLKNFDIIVPAALSQAPWNYDPLTASWVQTGALLNIPAMLVVLLMSGLLAIGTRESARFNDVIVLLKVTVVVLFIALGIGSVDHHNWITLANPTGSFVPPSDGAGNFGWAGVLRGAGVVFFAYIGFDAVSCAAQEAKNPQRDMPIGIIGSLVICSLLYAAVRVCADRHRALRQAQCVRSDCGGYRCARPALVLADHQTRCDRRSHHRGAGAVARPDPDFLFDVARWPAATDFFERASAFSHAVCHHPAHRCDCGDFGRSVADWSGRRIGQHRHARRVLHRLPRCAGAAQIASRYAAPVPRARHRRGCTGWCPLCLFPDVRSAG